MAEQRVPRRLAVVLAADVVGYSRLMELDEAATLATLKARRKELLEPLVARHEGRIFKVTGDGVLVDFVSAVNAVECAVALQRSMAEANSALPTEKRIELRIGINLGDVVVEGGDLYGDGERQLKNIAAAVRVYRTAPLPSPSVAAVPLPLPGKPSIAVLPFTNIAPTRSRSFSPTG
jgi:class 3 adenylate cyclase